MCSNKSIFYKLIFIVFIALFATLVLSQNFIYSCEEDPEGGDENPEDPIYIAGGKFFLPYVDIDISGISGIWNTRLKFIRYYSSQSSYSEGTIGYGWQHTYGAFITEIDNGNTVIIKDIEGSLWTYIKDGLVYEPANKEPRAQYSTLTKDGDQFIWRLKDGLTYRFELVADNKYRLVGIIDRTGNTLTLSYNENSQLTEVSDGAGRTLSFSYNFEGQIESVTDPMGRTVSYTYDENNRLRTVTDISGGITTYNYTDPNDIYNITEVIDPRGNFFKRLTYNDEDRTIIRTDALGNSENFNYSLDLHTVTITDKNGHIVVYSVDNDANITQVQDNFGTESYTYDNSGNVSSFTDKNESTIQYGYDDMGNIISMTDVLGNITSATYDPQFNSLINLTDASGNTYTAELDDEGNYTSVTDPLGDQTTAMYNGFGRPVSINDANGNITQFGYDQYGNLVEFTDALDNSTTLEYDLVGNLLSISDANDNTTIFTYNNNDRLTSEIDPLGNTISYQYDENGNLIAKTDQNNNTITYSYDELNQLISKTYPNGEEVSYEYDVQGNLISMTDSTGEYIYEYDEIDRVISVTGPFSNVVSYTYDPVGNRASMTNPQGITTSYSYNAMNMPTAISNPQVGMINFAYNNLLQRTNIQFPNNITTTYQYDTAGRVIDITSIKEEEIINQNIYSYDGVGTILSKTTLEGEETYAYDSIYQLISVEYSDDSWENFSYDAVGNRLTKEDQDGTVTYTYNALNQLIDEHGGNEGDNAITVTGTIDDDTAEVTVNGIEAEVGEGEFSCQIELEPGENQITAEAIDTAGNISSDTVTVTFSPQNTAIYSYDLNGNLTQKVTPAGTYDYSYNYDNLLMEVHEDGIQIAGYQYNALNKRVSKTAGGVNTRYAYDFWDVINETNQDGAIEASYLFGPWIDEVLALSRDGQTYCYNSDILGSVLNLTDSSGNIVNSYRYKVFGNLRSEVGTVPNSYRFTGRRWDSETGLYHYRLRTYNTHIGRFIQQDPIRQLGGLNLYTYVNNNPVNYTDPYGTTILGPLGRRIVKGGLRQLGKWAGKNWGEGGLADDDQFPDKDGDGFGEGVDPDDNDPNVTPNNPEGEDKNQDPSKK